MWFEEMTEFKLAYSDPLQLLTVPTPRAQTSKAATALNPVALMLL